MNPIRKSFNQIPKQLITLYYQHKVFWYVLVIISVSLGCSEKQKNSSKTDIHVVWKLIHNSTFEHSQAKASIMLRNKSARSLGSSNWILYFNMLPRDIIPSADTTFADVVHINGDWYKLVPRNNFQLESDSMVTIYYEFEGAQIKESDAPVGLYFVFYDEEGIEKEISNVTHYTIYPFTKPEQIKRSQYDCEPLPTAANKYNEYKRKLSDDPPQLLPLVPTPSRYEDKGDRCDIDKHFKIFCDKAAEPEARYLAKKFHEIAGLSLAVEHTTEIKQPGIYLVTNGIKGVIHEAYNLEIEPGFIQISGDKEGIFYGIQSLMNLIPFETFQNPTGQFELPAMVIEDAPRFNYRSLHIDICRNFQTKDQLLKIIDLMAWYKLNTLLLYLNEDEGWRLEIEELPELTEIGSKRGHTLDEFNCLHPSYGSGPFPDAADNHGTGYYSREEFKEIIRYAYERHIQVIPSINLPGHARAAIKAMEARYRRFRSEGKLAEADTFRLIDPEDKSMYKSAQYYNDNVVCVARESVYRFFETVLDDVLEMYKEAGVPIEMVYTGGDEVPEGVWTGSPMCRKLLTELPEINDSKNLQKYYLERINEILLQHNLKTGGWEEIALEKNADGNYTVNSEFIDKNVIPFVWNSLDGSQDLAYRLANTGYPVVLCPVTNFYLDLAYSNDPEEPGLYWNGFVNERKPWQMAPYNMFSTITKDGMGCKISEAEYLNMTRLKLHSQDNIIGLQAQLWHETIHGGEMMEYYLLPKLISFAERCWAQASGWESIPEKQKRAEIMDAKWRNFEYTIYEQELPKLRYLNGGYNYRIPPAGAIIKDDYLEVLTSNPALKVRYALNGNNPDNTSAIYNEPIEVRGEIRLQVFDKSGKFSKVSVINQKDE